MDILETEQSVFPLSVLIIWFQQLIDDSEMFMHILLITTNIYWHMVSPIDYLYLPVRTLPFSDIQCYLCHNRICHEMSMVKNALHNTWIYIEICEWFFSQHKLSDRLIISILPNCNNFMSLYWDTKSQSKYL